MQIFIVWACLNSLLEMKGIFYTRTEAIKLKTDLEALKIFDSIDIKQNKIINCYDPKKDLTPYEYTNLTKL